MGGSWKNKKFSYGDILVSTDGPGVTSGIKDGGNPQMFDKNNVVNSGYNNSNMKCYFKITPNGLERMYGFYDINGNKYYLNNGLIQTGWQTTNNVNWFYCNPITGVVETGWQTINGNKYYFNNSGIMQTGWQTIEGKKYYFDLNTGIMYIGFKNIDGKIYEFKNNNPNIGSLEGIVSISINGAENISINLGSKFNPMAGVTLNDIEDPQAKILVNGTVDTNMPGVYKLTYTVKDNYGQTVSVIRDVVVKGSKTEDIYWDNNSLVINGDIVLNNKEISKNTPKEIIIKNSKGNIVASSNTVAVNWYSKDKNDYTGYQGIFTNEQLSNLNPNEIYNVYIKMDGSEVPISNDIVLKSDKNYTIASKNGELTIESNMKKISNGVIYETGYFTDYGYVLNGNLYLNNTIFNKSDSKMLVIKDANGNVVDKVKCASMNWYSSNSNNYSGFQGIFTNSELNKLKAGEKYSFEIEVNQNGKTYTFPIKNEDNFVVNTGINYNIATNSENDLTIVKKIQNESISSGKTTVEDEYWEPYGYVMNIKVGDNKEIPKGTKMQLISKDSSGKVVLVVNGVDVNWYSNNEENYNGFQVIIAPDQVKNILGKNKLYVKVILNGHIKEFSI